MRRNFFLHPSCWILLICGMFVFTTVAVADESDRGARDKDDGVADIATDAKSTQDTAAQDEDKDTDRAQRRRGDGRPRGPNAERRARTRPEQNGRPNRDFRGRGARGGRLDGRAGDDRRRPMDARPFGPGRNFGPDREERARGRGRGPGRDGDWARGSDERRERGLREFDERRRRGDQTRNRAPGREVEGLGPSRMRSRGDRPSFEDMAARRRMATVQRERANFQGDRARRVGRPNADQVRSDLRELRREIRELRGAIQDLSRQLRSE